MSLKTSLNRTFIIRSKSPFPLMPQTIPKPKTTKSMCSQNTLHKEPTGKRHVSYGRNDLHIKEAEERLMNKYHMGYSQLHKYLVLKEGNTQFSVPYL